MSNPASPGYYRPPVSPFGGVFTRPYFWDRFSVQTREAVCRAEWKGRRVTDPYELEGEYCPIGLALRLDGFIHEWDRARIPVESLPGILGVTVEDPS
jgi:hypothetical protein